MMKMRDKPKPKLHYGGDMRVNHTCPGCGFKGKWIDFDPELVDGGYDTILKMHKKDVAYKCPKCGAVFQPEKN